MNDNGNIRRFENEAEAQKAGFKTMLTEKEEAYLNQCPESIRHYELALFRFCEERERLKAPMNLSIRNAFKLGYYAGKGEA